jgi:hypothetical protein
MARKPREQQMDRPIYNTDTHVRPALENPDFLKKTIFRGQEHDDPRQKAELAREPYDPLTFLNGVSMNLPQEYMDSLPDYEFCMIAYQLGGLDKKEYYADAINRKWEPILCSEHPSLALNIAVSPYDKEKDDDFYKKRGHIGMKRLKSIGIAERNYYMRIANEHAHHIREHAGNESQYSGLRTIQNDVYYAR